MMSGPHMGLRTAVGFAALTAKACNICAKGAAPKPAILPGSPFTGNPGLGHYMTKMVVLRPVGINALI